MHDQQIAVGKGQCFPVSGVLPMSQTEIACGSQRQGCDRLAVVDLGLIIGMPAHAIVPMAVEVEQAAVEISATGVNHSPGQWLEPVRPAVTMVHCAAVAVGQTIGTEKLRHPWHRVTPSVHLHNRLLPVDLMGQQLLPLRSFSVREPMAS